MKPVLLYTSNSNISMTGKMVIAGTAFLTSVSSTLMLQYCSKPYILSLEEVVSKEISPTDRQFIATTLTFFGASKKTTFNLSQVERLTSKIHPFATFKVKDDLFFVFGGNVSDIELRNKFTGAKQ